MSRPTDDQPPYLPRHTTDADLGAAMTRAVAMLRPCKTGDAPDRHQKEAEGGRHMSASERIWAIFEAHKNPKDSAPRVFASASETKGQEYVRVDLCDPTQDDRVRALVDAAERLADLWDKDATDRIGPATRQIRVALRALEQG